MIAREFGTLIGMVFAAGLWGMIIGILRNSAQSQGTTDHVRADCPAPRPLPRPVERPSRFSASEVGSDDLVAADLLEEHGFHEQAERLRGRC